MLDREDAGTREADRVDAGMIAEPPVLDRDHRVLHDLRRLAQRQPAPVIGTQRQADGAVGGVDADRLPGGRLLERLDAGTALYRDRSEERRVGEEGVSWCRSRLAAFY